MHRNGIAEALHRQFIKGTLDNQHSHWIIFEKKAKPLGLFLKILAPSQQDLF